MNALVDTNILVRLRELNSPDHPACTRALSRLLQRGDGLFICAQVAIEYWVVATRPKAANGLGLSPAEAEADLRDFEQMLVWLPEPADIGARWRKLVNRYGVLGVRAHDARLVALMEAHALTHVLTLNREDFEGYDGISVLLPSDVR
jgi:predicted nucleic acid-binding protein